jgi:hypothetical protein
MPSRASLADVTVSVVDIVAAGLKWDGHEKGAGLRVGGSSGNSSRASSTKLQQQQQQQGLPPPSKPTVEEYYADPLMLP